MNDFESLLQLGARRAHRLDIQVKKAIFSIGIGNQYKGQLSKKEWQDLIDFEGAMGFSSCWQSSGEGGLLSYATLGAL
jgi:hypothetical protein